MSWKFVGREAGERQVADFLAGFWVFEKLQRGGFVELALIALGLVGVACLPVAEVRKGFETRRAGRHFLGAEFLQRERVAGDVEKLVVTLLAPILKSILVK